MPYSAQTPYCVITAIAVPVSYVVSPDSSDADLLCLEFTKKELEGMKLVGLPVKIEHTGSVAIGFVVDNSWNDKLGLVVKIEIPMIDSRNTVAGRNLMYAKEIVTKGIEFKRLCDVSICHSMRIVPPNSGGKWGVYKHVLEISLVVEGAKVGSNILGVSWSTIPYSINKQYKSYTGNESDYTTFTYLTLPSKPVTVPEPKAQNIPIIVRSKNMSTTANPPVQGQAATTTAGIVMPTVQLTPAEQLAQMEARMKEMNENFERMRQEQAVTMQKAAEYDKILTNNNKEAVKELETAIKESYALANEHAQYLPTDDTNLATVLKDSSASFNESINRLNESINGRDSFTAADFQQVTQTFMVPMVACSKEMKAMIKKLENNSSAPTTQTTNAPVNAVSVPAQQTSATTAAQQPPMLPSKQTTTALPNALSQTANLLFVPLGVNFNTKWRKVLTDDGSIEKKQ
jgi:hypothetical protein